ncbi:hypothetical protein P8452_28525 [Trifolium repens]|nr:hypothetical protein P8452_28525 [Trifolium repens]
MGVVGSMTDRGSNILPVQPRILDIVIGIVDNLVWHKNLPLGVVDVLSFWVESYECTVGFESFEPLDSTGTIIIFFLFSCLIFRFCILILFYGLLIVRLDLVLTLKQGFILIIQESGNRGCWDKRHCGDDSSSHKVFAKNESIGWLGVGRKDGKISNSFELSMGFYHLFLWLDFSWLHRYLPLPRVNY